MDSVKRGELSSATQLHVRPCEAVGLLLGHQRRRALLGQPGLALNGVAVLVGEHHRHAHVAVGVAQRGQEFAAVPSDGLVVVAERRIDESVRVLAAELAVESVGVPGDQCLDRDELAVERLAVNAFPVLLDVADRMPGQLVDLAVVGVLHVP